MRLLAAGVPLTLLLDLATPPHSVERLPRPSPATADWLSRRPASPDRSRRAGATASRSGLPDDELRQRVDHDQPARQRGGRQPLARTTP